MNVGWWWVGNYCMSWWYLPLWRVRRSKLSWKDNGEFSQSASAHANQLRGVGVIFREEMAARRSSMFHKNQNKRRRIESDTKGEWAWVASVWCICARVCGWVCARARCFWPDILKPVPAFHSLPHSAIRTIVTLPTPGLRAEWQITGSVLR